MNRRRRSILPSTPGASHRVTCHTTAPDESSDSRNISESMRPAMSGMKYVKKDNTQNA
jgi:hypothetical protein